jgi:hypothetical protein
MAVPLYPDPPSKKPIPNKEDLHYKDDVLDGMNEDTIKDALKEMNMEHPDYNEKEGEPESNPEIKEKKKSKKNYLIFRLEEPSHIIEDITHGLRVVLFVENNKRTLKDKEQGEGLHRKELIKKLKEERDSLYVIKTSFYFTDCEFLNNLCYEMKINPKENQVVYISKFKSKPISMKSPKLVDEIWGTIAQKVETVENIDALNRMVDNQQMNVVLFNIDDTTTVTEKEQAFQLERAERLVEKCKDDCFNEMLFVSIKEKDAFLNHENNKGKTFLMRKGELLPTPFKLRGHGKMGLNKSLKMINNEGLADVLVNNNENYFRIYQNDMKAMIVLILNTDNELRKEMLIDEFNQASRKHRQYRPDFENRYTFVLLDLKDSDPHYKNMMLEVTGDINTEAEIFLFTRSGISNKYENYKLSENIEDLHGFLNSLKERISQYHEMTKKKEEIESKKEKKNDEKEETDDRFPDYKNFKPHELAILEMGRLYLRDWESLDSVLKIDDEESEDINSRNLLGFINTHDLGLLSHQFYKSAEDDHEYNQEHMMSGLLQVTGNNFDRLVYNVTPEDTEYPEVHHSFIMVVCRNHNDDDEEDCQRLAKLINFLRKHFPKEDSEIRIGMFDQTKNDHPAIENFDIKSFPVLIFFGKKEKTGKGKIFRGKLIVDKVFRWLNKKFIENEDAIVELDERHYLELLIEMARNDE